MCLIGLLTEHGPKGPLAYHKSIHHGSRDGPTHDQLGKTWRGPPGGRGGGEERCGS